MTLTANVRTIYDAEASLATTREDLSALIPPSEWLRFGVIGTGCIGARSALPPRLCTSFRRVRPWGSPPLCPRV